MEPRHGLLSEQQVQNQAFPSDPCEEGIHPTIQAGRTTRVEQDPGFGSEMALAQEFRASSFESQDRQRTLVAAHLTEYVMACQWQGNAMGKNCWSELGKAFV